VDRRSRVRDGTLGSVPRDESGMVGEADHDALLENPRDGVCRLRTSLLVDDVEDFLDGAAERVLFAPTGQAFGFRVADRDARLLLGREDDIANAVESCREELFRPQQLVRSLAPLRQVARDLGEPNQLSVGATKRGDDDVGPEAAAVLSNSPAFVLDPALATR